MATKSSPRSRVGRVLAASLLLLCAVYFSTLARGDQQGVWSGVVSDTKCGKKGHAVGDAVGVKNCVLEGAKYALLTSEGGLYELDPQSMAAAYAGEQVAVTGSRDGRTIKIASIQRIGQPGAATKPARIDERSRIMRTVRRIHILSRSSAEMVGIDPEPLMAKLLKEPEFQDGTWQLVDSPANADLTIELTRVPWTWDFTYRITHPPSGLVFGSGKVIAWDGVRAASGLEKKIIKDLRAIRPEALPSAPRPANSLEPIETTPDTDTQTPQQEAKPQATRLPPAVGAQIAAPPKPAPASAPLTPPKSAPTSSVPSTNLGDLSAFRMRVEVQLVLVEAVVQGPGGIEPTGALSSLSKGDFRLLEDGLDQPIQHFSRDELPLAVALVVDISGSVAPYMDQLRQAALETLAQLKPGDRVALFSFADRTQRVVDLTTDTRQVAWGIGQIGGGGMTDIFDALADAVSYLQTEAPAQRRVVILVSDNTPTVESRVSAQEVTRMALQAECAIYSIQTPGQRALPQFRRPGRVEEIARETGGEVIGTQRAGSVGAALAAVMRRLKTRYTLGYYPSNKAHDGTFRVIEVYLTDRFGQLHLDYRILARRGYYAPRAGVPTG
jgi:VWFA-related protein